MDLSEQLELKAKQNGVIKLYRSMKLDDDELANLKQNIGKLISPNGYLTTSSKRSVAYDCAIKSGKREGIVRALFEYQIDLNVVQNVVIADVQEYSAFPEKAEFIIDIGMNNIK